MPLNGGGGEITKKKKKMARLLDNGQLTFSTAVRIGRERNTDPVIIGNFCMIHVACLSDSFLLFFCTVKILRCLNRNKWSFHSLAEAEMF